MVRFFLIFWSFLFFGIVEAQNLDAEKLNNEIYQLNNENNFIESIRRLDAIVNSPHYTNYDKYLAYLQKSFTYKRLFSYSQAKTNLNLAYEIGIKSPQKEEVEVRVLVEKIFHAFDFMKFNEVETLMNQLKGKNLDSLDDQTHAFFLSVLGILEKRKGNHKVALDFMDQAIVLLKKSSPSDLPNIYRKKLEIYTDLNNHQLALDAYDSGIYYANQYNMIVYKIGMNESLRDYYRKMENYQRAFYHQQIVDTLKYEYNFNNKASQIIDFEKELTEKRKNIELESERTFKNTLLFISIICLILAGLIFYLFRKKQKKTHQIKLENERIRKELEILTHEKGDAKLEYSEFELTARQLEIIELVRQGYTNKAIGEKLFISENTVKYHLRTIYSILGVENRYDLK